MVTRRRLLGGLVAVPVVGAGFGSGYAAAGALPRVNVRDHGARGDGRTNDTTAFQAAAAELDRAKGGTLVIPPGVYIVGRQGGASAGYAYEPVFTAAGFTFLDIQGTGAMLRTQPGLRYGEFGGHGVGVGRMVELTDCADVSITGLELDGNNENLIIGGPWGDTGIQTAATGIWLNRCSAVRVVDVHTHHHGLDGIAVLHREFRVAGPKPHELLRVRSEYNGRQGLSWIGGWGLTCTDCSFSHSGRAAVFSKPGAGIDIEPNRDSPVEITVDGMFDGCQIVNNVGNGVEISNGDSRDNTFRDCTIWGTTQYAIYVAKPGVRFVGCDIHGYFERVYGSTDPAQATSFRDCTITDKPWTDGRVFRKTYLYDSLAGSEGVGWTNCWFNARASRSVRVEHRQTLTNCGFTHGFAGVPSGQHHAYFKDALIIGGRFTEVLPGTTPDYSIWLVNTEVRDVPGGRVTTVEGPRVRWRSGGQWRVGTIPSGIHNS